MSGWYKISLFLCIRKIDGFTRNHFWFRSCTTLSCYVNLSKINLPEGNLPFHWESGCKGKEFFVYPPNFRRTFFEKIFGSFFFKRSRSPELPLRTTLSSCNSSFAPDGSLSSPSLSICQWTGAFADVSFLLRSVSFSKAGAKVEVFYIYSKYFQLFFWTFFDESS